MRIHIRYKRIIFAFCMALSISCFVSFMLVSINFGYNDTFMQTWLKIWSEAFVCAFFGSYFFPIGINKLMSKIQFVEKSLNGSGKEI
ncbi:hypothetical protein CHN50_06420 [Priestia aryabhattai]|nr:DUF2798 domain-containing protein [Priestia flexa]MDT2045527.1 DUF2798 domain-containing protein [Priestia flexa]OZT13417.1 hypothetical protein CHN50_06420 [Priestia aryabhattai]USY54418.1 DUF2798 domain-containing protein [Bacillus sp. 1780r2a1]